jgi:hypothetical protein
MSDSFTLPTVTAAQDLAVLLGRAARLDDAGAVRLIADSGVLAMYVAVLTPKGLLDRSPTVLGLRTTALLEGSFDAIVPVASLQARVDAALAASPEGSVTVRVPATVNTVVWAAISPPRGGWQRMAPLEAAPFVDAARAGIEEVAAAIPENTGEQIVHRVRTEVWGRPLEGADHLPAAVAFAGEALGFFGDDPVQQFAAGPWIRLSTQRGHVLVKQGAWSLGG